MKQQIITELFLSKNFNDCINKMKPEYLRDDLKAEVILVICELDETKLKGLYDRGELNFYVARVILNMIKSTSSSFYRKYRKTTVEYNHNEELESDKHLPGEIEHREHIELLQDISVKEIDSLYWYDAELLKLYMKLGTYRAIEKETGIPFESVYKTVRKSINQIKCKVLPLLS